MRIFSFPPIVTPASKILVLGTMPGKDSLKHNQYYAHPRNAFWKIMFTLFNAPVTANYDLKKQLLLQNKIALWDVLKACERESSLDSDIEKEEANELNGFLQGAPFIEHLFFNGNNPFLYYKKHVGEIPLPYTILPSTSPAHAVAFEEKLKEWSVIKCYVE